MKISSREEPQEKKPRISSKGLRFFVVGIVLISVFILGILANQAQVFPRLWGSVEPPLTEAIDEVSVEINTEAHLYQSNGLETLTFDIPFESMQSLEAVREEALVLGFRPQSDDQYVPASIRVDENRSIDVELRLKGDWNDHYSGDKWSFRIHVQADDEAVMGMRRFSIQAPETRNFLYEWLYHQTLMNEGVLSTSYNFVNVVVNGDYKGIYAIEESFSEELLETQGREAGIIYRLTEDPLWERRQDLASGGLDFIWSVEQMGYFLVTNGYDSELDIYRQGAVEGDEALNEQWVEGEEMLYSYLHGYLSSAEVLDEELWGKYYAIVDMFAASHSVIWHNLRFYYNPATGLIEPIGYDGNAMNDHYSALTPNDQYSLLLENPGIQRVYVETLTRLSDPAYFDALQAEFNSQSQALNDVLAREYTTLDSNDTFWYKYRLRADIIRRNLNPQQTVHGGYQIVDADDGTALQLGIVNMMMMPVEVVEIAVGDQVLAAVPAWCASDQCHLHTVSGIDEVVMLSEAVLQGRSTTFTIPLSDADRAVLTAEAAVPITLRTRLYGGATLFEMPIYSNVVPQGVTEATRPQVTLEEALAAHPFLYPMNNHVLAVDRGDWDVSGDLVIPEGYSLLLLGDTTLRFEEGALLLVNDKVNFSGNEEQLITLTAQDESWGGLVVFGGTDESTLSYTIVEKTAGVSRGGWLLTGGATFYESPVAISYATFAGAGAAEALNIVRSDFTMDHVAITSSGGDGFASDFASGTMTMNSFSDIDGEGLIANGSFIDMDSVTFTRIGGAALHAIRSSQITARDLTIQQAKIGLLVSDFAHLTLRKVTLTDVSTAALVACQEDAAYGPGMIEAGGLHFNGAIIESLAQIGSTIIIEDRRMPESAFDLADLLAAE